MRMKRKILREIREDAELFLHDTNAWNEKHRSGKELEIELGQVGVHIRCKKLVSYFEWDDVHTVHYEHSEGPYQDDWLWVQFNSTAESLWIPTSLEGADDLVSQFIERDFLTL